MTDRQIPTGIDNLSIGPAGKAALIVASAFVLVTGAILSAVYLLVFVPLAAFSLWRRRRSLQGAAPLRPGAVRRTRPTVIDGDCTIVE